MSRTTDTSPVTGHDCDAHATSAASHSDSASPARSPPLPPGSGRGWILDANDRTDAAADQQFRREYHRDHMVAFRQRKKQSLASMRALHAQLEAQLAKQLTQRRALLLSGCPLGGVAGPFDESLTPAQRAERFREIFGGLVEEAELHRTQNAALRGQLEQFAKLKLLLHHELEQLRQAEEPEPAPTPPRANAKTSELRNGFFVYFEPLEPPFYFEPFTRLQCDEATRDGYCNVRTLQDAFDSGALGVREVECLGWRAQRSIERAAQASDGAPGALISRVRFTKLMHCARGNVETSIDTLASHAFEWLSSAEKYARIHRTKFVSHTLQTFGSNQHVSLRNAPEPGGTTSIRYLHLLTRVADIYTHPASGDACARATVLMLAMDSPRHKLLRETVLPRDDILWMTEGTAFLSFVQLDDATFEVDFGNVAACVSDEQAQYFMIELGAQLLRWECLVMPPRLLVAATNSQAA